MTEAQCYYCNENASKCDCKPNDLCPHTVHKDVSVVRAAHAVKVPRHPDDEFLIHMSEQVRTQDNLATRNPIFMVQRRRRIYGMNTEWVDDVAWMSEDGEYEATGDERMELEEWFIKTGDDEHNGYHRVGYIDIWENIQPFFTREGAERYLRDNEHNLKPEAQIYVESGYRNTEWQAIRALLLRLWEKED